MKSIAVFLILNILLLSSITGMANIYHGKAACAASKMHKDCCKEQKQSSDNDCAKGICNVILSCGTSGFIITLPLSFSPAVIDLHQGSAHLFEVGALSDYHANDWNPPKA